MEQIKEKILIFTQVYNCEEYLTQTIESVLAQTYPHFEYHIIDNGSTDGTRAITQDFAQRDHRIVLHLFEENDPFRWVHSLRSPKETNCKYATTIDGDDWWDPEYLKRLIGFLEENDLDIAITGTVAHCGKDEQILRSIPSPVMLSRQEFANDYPSLWTYPSTCWANIMKLEMLPTWSQEMLRSLTVGYGADTVYMLQCLTSCNRIGIDNSAMYHYRIHPKSISFQYNTRRFDANVVYYEAIRDFLEQHNTFDEEKQNWLKRVHIASMNATLNLLYESSISALEKLTECIRIIDHPLTSYVLTAEFDEKKQWYNLMRAIVSQTGGSVVDKECERRLRKVFQFIAPTCVAAFSVKYIHIYAAEESFWIALITDDRETAVSTLIDWISQGKYTEQFDLGKLLNSLIPDGFLLKDESDTQFFKMYAESCRMILKNDLDSALEQMTGILLENDDLYAEDRYLKLYLSIAALQNQISAFLYGNIRLAYLYFDQGKYDECRSILNDLEEMGAGDSDDVVALKKALDEML